MNNFPISLGTKLRIDSRDRLDIKLGLDIGYLVLMSSMNGDFSVYA